MRGGGRGRDRQREYMNEGGLQIQGKRHLNTKIGLEVKVAIVY